MILKRLPKKVPYAFSLRKVRPKKSFIFYCSKCYSVIQFLLITSIIIIIVTIISI